MGIEVTAAVNAFINERIVVPLPDIQASVATRNWLEDRLSAYLSARPAEPQLYAPQRFLHFGSYFKGTNVGSVDEFDILVVLDSNGGQFSRGGMAIGSGRGTADPNHKYDSRFQKVDGSGVSPLFQLRWLKSIADSTFGPYGVAPSVMTPQSVKVAIGASDTEVELVPAGVFLRGWTDQFYNIPSGNADSWTVTQPESDIQRVEDTARTRPRFRHLLRTVKHLNAVYDMGMPSFALETAVVDAVQFIAWFDYEDLNLQTCIDGAANALKNKWIADPYDPGANLLAGHQETASLAGQLFAAIGDQLRLLDAAALTAADARGAVFKLLGRE